MPKLAVSYERTKDDKLLLSFTAKLEIIFLKQYQGHIQETHDGKCACYQV